MSDVRPDRKRTWVEARSHGAILDDSAHTDVQGTSSVFVGNDGTGGGRLESRDMARQGMYVTPAIAR